MTLLADKFEATWPVCRCCCVGTCFSWQGCCCYCSCCGSILGKTLKNKCPSYSAVEDYVVAVHAVLASDFVVFVKLHFEAAASAVVRSSKKL